MIILNIGYPTVVNEPLRSSGCRSTKLPNPSGYEINAGYANLMYKGKTSKNCSHLSKCLLKINIKEHWCIVDGSKVMRTTTGLFIILYNIYIFIG